MRAVSPDRQPTKRRPQPVRMFVELADSLVDDYDLSDFLHRLLGHCTSSVNVRAAALLLKNHRGGVDLIASSSERSEDIEVFQSQAGNGPCLDAIAAGARVRAGDLTAQQDRWPRWSETALAAGIRSVYATPMRLGFETIGALTMVGSHPNAVSDDDLTIIQAFTDIASIAIIHERLLNRSDTVTEQLQAALDSRVLIEQATGVVAGRTGLDLSMERAFLLIRDYGQRTNTKLGTVCHAIVHGTLDTSQVISEDPMTERRPPPTLAAPALSTSPPPATALGPRKPPRGSVQSGRRSAHAGASRADGRISASHPGLPAGELDGTKPLKAIKALLPEEYVGANSEYGDHVIIVLSRPMTRYEETAFRRLKHRDWHVQGARLTWYSTSAEEVAASRHLVSTLLTQAERDGRHLQAAVSPGRADTGSVRGTEIERRRRLLGRINFE